MVGVVTDRFQLIASLSMRDYYKILGVNEKAATEEIKRVFRAKALLLHPDKSKRNTNEEFIELFEAYAILSDKKKRERYDLIYDWIKPESNDSKQQELKKELILIHEKGAEYAKDFSLFDKDVLNKIFLEFLLVLDRLVVVCLVASVVGITTMVQGLINFDLGYSLAGVVVTLVGIFFGKMKLDHARNYYQVLEKEIAKRKATK